MPVFRCTGCEGTTCTIIVEGETDCELPEQCNWKGENVPVFREMKVVD